MAIDMQVIKASEFVRVDADEKLDFQASKIALQNLAMACVKRGLNRALVDLRPLPLLPKPRFTPTELAALVSSFREAGFSRQQRLAILYDQDVHGGARNFAFFSRLRGLQVQAFSDYETALKWLSDFPEGGTEFRRRASTVPILQPKSDIKKLMVASGTDNSGSTTFRRNQKKAK